MQDKQPEALILANDRPWQVSDDLYQWAMDAEDMLRDQYAELQQWKNVFGHLGTADECGNEWIRLQDSIKRKDALLQQALETLENDVQLHCYLPSREYHLQTISAITKELQ